MGACGDEQAVDVGIAYLTSAAARRTEMERSLAGVENGYARLRRKRYATGDAGDWDRLPVWNPRVAALRPNTLDATIVVGGTSPFLREPLSLDVSAEARAGAATALRDLGEAAFFRYPAQLLPSDVGLAAADLARYGLWRDDTHGWGGLVQAEMADGSARLALTCATCHATPRQEILVPGLGNSTVDLGGWLADTAERVQATNVAGDRLVDTTPLRAWGAGRVDVATTDGHLPVKFPDLRPVRWLTHLHYEADVAQQSIASLAVRLETLLITSHGEGLRPPREVALALATYVWSLADTLPPLAIDAAAQAGAAAFRATCAVCHAGPGLTGPPVDAARVGTDTTAAFDPERGTGRYRVPSLRGVAARGALMHDGSISGLPSLLDPARLMGGTLAPGHPFGLDFDDATRAALLDYLERL
jgi:cytochrome c5